MEPFYSSQFFFRYLSVLFSYAFIKLRIGSNAITFISLIVAILGAILLSFNDVQLLLLSIILMNLYNILDHCDGEVARYEIQVLKMKKGPEGPYFDAIVHYIFTPLVFGALAIHSYNETGLLIDLWSGILTFMWLSSFGQAAALRVIMDYLFSGKGDLKIAESIWKHDKVVPPEELNFKLILRKLIREVFSTQGQIIVVSMAVIIDLTIQSEIIQIKTIVLYFFGCISLVGLHKSIYQFFIKLKGI